MEASVRPRFRPPVIQQDPMRIAARTLITGVIMTAAFATAAHAQKMTPTGMGRGGSPHVKSDWTVRGAKIAIEYGRPSLKGRPEAQMMPAGTPWRTGADAATTITTDKALTFGTVVLEPGTYTIFTQPGAQEWQLIFGTLKAPGQWGVPYQKDLELSRTPMKLGKAKKPVEMVTYHIDKTAKGGTLRIEWGTVSVSAPFTVRK